MLYNQQNTTVPAMRSSPGPDVSDCTTRGPARHKSSMAILALLHASKTLVKKHSHRLFGGYTSGPKMVNTEYVLGGRFEAGALFSVSAQCRWHFACVLEA